MRVRLECTTGGSNKFWEIQARVLPVTPGQFTQWQLVTRWGRLGTKGQEKWEDFFSMNDAHKSAITQIQKKLQKGYVEVHRDYDDHYRAGPKAGQPKPKPAPPEPSLIPDPGGWSWSNAVKREG